MNTNQTWRRLWLFLGLSLLISASYYGVFRWWGLPNDPTFGTFPSFIFALSFTVLARMTASARSPFLRELLASGWLLATLLFEPILATFDIADVIMAVVGYVLAWPLSRFLSQRSGSLPVSPVFHALAVASGLFFIVGSACHDCGYDYESHEPVYMSYEELRSAVKVSEAREFDNVGTFVLYGDYILLNERNQGVHVIDNSNPAAPSNLAFVEIPGNTSLVVRNDIVFADSYIDLVAIDASDAANIREVARQIDIFPYDAYQAIEDDVNFYYEQEKGVVIGYD